MCIIALSPTGIDPLTKDVLEICFANNGDGAGFCWYDNDEDTWYAEKGYMSFKDFWKAYAKHEFNKDDCVACHFRIGTSGYKDGGNTHPFPIISDIEKMRETKFKTRTLAIHNGVIGAGEVVGSDTMVHVRDYLHTLLQFVEQEPEMLRISEELSEPSKNRWFITNGDVYYKWGTWKKDETTGWEFSNDSWKYRKVSTIVYPAAKNYNMAASNPMLPARTGPGQEPVGKKNFNDYFDRNGDFHAADWRTDMARNLGLVRSEKNGNTKQQDNNFSKNAPSDDLFLYGLIGDDGQVLWDKVSDSQKTGVNTPEYLYCPDCFEDKHLMTSPYDIGDTLCCSCGAIFLDASGRIIKYDPDVHTSYVERMTKKNAAKAAAGGE